VFLEASPIRPGRGKACLTLMMLMEVFRFLEVKDDLKTLYIASGRFSRLCTFP
jgi:hypothetical protein